MRVVAGAIRGRAGAGAAIDAVREEVLDCGAGFSAGEVMAEDVIGDGGGDGGVGFAVGLTGLELGLGEEAITQEGEGGDYVLEGSAGDFLGFIVYLEFVDQVEVDVSEVARGVVEGGLGGVGSAAVVEAVEGWVHFQEVGLVAFEGLEVGAAACVDLNGARVDADGEDDAVIVGGDEIIGGLVAVVGGEVVVFGAEVSVRGVGFIGEVIVDWMGENLIVLIFPIDIVRGDVG